ncbi:DNA polymerase Y family protein [Streptomyces murinus]|uniref:DNA polymerase Y family protein n=1 Tax=Streptomyces murinus TaxID=33900 RepID=UPI0037FDCE6A
MSPAEPPAARPRYIAHLHLHVPPADMTEQRWSEVLDTLTAITPAVQILPPTAVQLDLTGALRYHDCSPRDLAGRVLLRLAAWWDITASAAVAGNRMIAAMACAETPPGRITMVGSSPQQAQAWLRPRRITALPGVGPATAARLRRLGLHSIGQIVDLPPETLQRALASAPAARDLAARARGHDPRPVTASEPAQRLVADHLTQHDELDPDAHHRTVLALAEQIGIRLRDQDLAAGRLTLSVRYADRSSSTRTRSLPEPTAHSPVLAATALGALASLGLQRARVRAYSLSVDQLRPRDEAHQQLLFDPADERARAAEAASDRARHRFGEDAVRPASLAAPSAPYPARRRGGGPPGVASP